MSNGRELEKEKQEIFNWRSLFLGACRVRNCKQHPMERLQKYRSFVLLSLLGWKAIILWVAFKELASFLLTSDWAYFGGVVYKYVNTWLAIAKKIWDVRWGKGNASLDSSYTYLPQSPSVLTKILAGFQQIPLGGVFSIIYSLTLLKTVT